MMARRLTRSCKVSPRATLFDKNESHEWFKSVYGNEWETARCFGTIRSVKRSSCTVQWSGGEMTSIDKTFLTLERDSDEGSDECEEEEEEDEILLSKKTKSTPKDPGRFGREAQKR